MKNQAESSLAGDALLVGWYNQCTGKHITRNLVPVAVEMPLATSVSLGGCTKLARSSDPASIDFGVPSSCSLTVTLGFAGCLD